MREADRCQRFLTHCSTWQRGCQSLCTMDLSCFVSAGLALTLYLNTLTADFAYDDSRAIVKNPDLLPETPWVHLLYDDFWGTPLTHSGSHKSYRPLCVLTFRLNYYLHGLQPWGFHLGNVLCHALTTYVFALLARRLLVRTFPTLVAGLMFAAHPIHTEAVAGIVGRADVLSCLFYLLTLLAYFRYAARRDQAPDPGGGGSGNARTGSGSGGGRWGWMLVVVLCAAAALLTKEQAVTVLASCVTYDVFLLHRAPLRDVVTLKVLTSSHYRRLREGLLCLCLCGAALLTVRIALMGSRAPDFAPSDNPASDSDSLLTRTLTFHFLPALNLWLLLWPYRLSFDWSMSAVALVESPRDPRNMATALFYFCLGYLTLRLSQTLAAKAEVLSSVANGNGLAHNHIHSSSKFSHVPASSLPSHSPSHRRTLPAHGACWDSARASSATRRGSTSSWTARPVPERSLPVLVLALSVMVFPFVPASNLFFYVGFVVAERILYIPSMGLCLLVAHGASCLEAHGRRGPGWRRAVRAGVVLLLLLFSARTWRRNQDWESEEKLYASGIAVNPAKAWGNLANVLNDKGQVAEAEEAYRNALKYRGNMADVHYNLGILLQHQGRVKEAIESYKTAISYRPKLTVAHLNLAILTAQTGDLKSAAAMYRHCADLDTSGLKDPRLHEQTKVSCLYNLARQFADVNQLQLSEETYLEALRRRPSYYPAQSIQNMLGELYMKMNRLEDAERWYREALRSKPDHVPAHLTLAKLFQHKNMDEEALRWFERARAVSPTDGSVDHHQAQFYLTRDMPQQAADLYKVALAKSPQDFDVAFSAANVFRTIGDNENAEKYYRQAAELRPKESAAQMNLGAMLHVNGKLQEAEACYLAALRLRPDDAVTRDNLVKLRSAMATKGAP